MQRSTDRIIKIKFLVIFLFLVFFAVSEKVEAADLLLSTPSNSYSFGSTFSVSIFVNTDTNQSINAVSSHLTFPKDKLSVVSLSKTNSIVSIWATEPTFSNVVGSIDLEGVILNPGFTGKQGKVLTINFKVKSTGPASIFLGASSILANDGKGTNVLGNLKNISLALTQAPAIVAAPNPSTTPSPLSQVVQVATSTATTSDVLPQVVTEPILQPQVQPPVQSPVSTTGEISLVINISPTMILIILFSLPLLLPLFFILGVIFAKRILMPNSKKEQNIPPTLPRIGV